MMEEQNVWGALLHVVSGAKKNDTISFQTLRSPLLYVSAELITDQLWASSTPTKNCQSLLLCRKSHPVSLHKPSLS